MRRVFVIDVFGFVLNSSCAHVIYLIGYFLY